jgi:hypothetical protein
MDRGLGTVATPFGRRTTVVVLLSLWCGSPTFAQVPPGEKLVPATAKFFLTCRNVRGLEEAARKTQFGHLADDPVMKPFGEDLQLQLDSLFSAADVQLGIRFEDVRGVCDGQASVAVVPLVVAEGAPPKTGTVLLLDVTNHQPQVAQLQQKIAAALAQHNAQAQPLATPGGAKGTHYVVPPKDPTGVQREVVEVVQSVGGSTVWLIGDEPSLPTFCSAALGGAQAPTLDGHDVFAALYKQTTPPPAEPPANIAFYFDPLGFPEALRAYQHPAPKLKPDPLAVFRAVGFDALQGVGGQASLSIGDYGLLVRLGISAPQPWQKSMNMLSFVPGADFAPQTWVAADVAAYAGVYWDVLTAFDHFGPLFDGFLEDEGIWNDVLDSLETDPDGPQIKIRNDFFALAGKRVTGIVDRHTSPGVEGAQYLLAFESTNVAQVAITLKKAFENDKTVSRVKLGDLDAYELTATEDVPPNAPNQQGVVNGQRKIVSGFVTAANGHFFIASDLDILKKVIGPAPAKLLANAPDYVAVTAELKKFLPPAQPQLVGLGFARLDELVRDDYESFRAGKLEYGQTGVGRILSLSLTEEDKVKLREKKIDGSKLPQFEEIKKYLSPMGLIVQTTPTGWSVTGLTYERAVPAGAAQAAAP